MAKVRLPRLLQGPSPCETRVQPTKGTARPEACSGKVPKRDGRGSPQKGCVVDCGLKDGQTLLRMFL